MNLQANHEFNEIGARARKEEECSALVKRCTPKNSLADFIFPEDRFNKLASFSKFVGLPIDNFDEKILFLLKILELRNKGKTLRQWLKNDQLY